MAASYLLPNSRQPSVSFPGLRPGGRRRDVSAPSAPHTLRVIFLRILSQRCKKQREAPQTLDSGKNPPPFFGWLGARFLRGRLSSARGRSHRRTAPPPQGGGEAERSGSPAELKETAGRTRMTRTRTQAITAMVLTCRGLPVGFGGSSRLCLAFCHHTRRRRCSASRRKLLADLRALT